MLQDVEYDTKEREREREREKKLGERTWKDIPSKRYILTYESKVLDRNMVKIAYSIRDYYVDYYASSLFNEIDDKKKKKKKKDSVNTHNLLRDNRFTEIEIAIVRKKSHTGFRQVKYRRFSLKTLLKRVQPFYAYVMQVWSSNGLAMRRSR